MLTRRQLIQNFAFTATVAPVAATWAAADAPFANASDAPSSIANAAAAVVTKSVFHALSPRA